MKSLTLVSHIASKNAHLPILQNVLITATSEGVLLTATNLEIGVTAKVRGKVDEPGSITVPASVVSNYIGLLSSERVDMEIEDLTLNITAGSQNTKIKGQPATEFPLIPEVDKVVEYTLPAGELRVALQQTLVATSNDQSRPELTGIQWNFSGKELTLAATDSYRLAERKLQLSSEVPMNKKFVTPGSSVAELLRMLPDAEEETVHCVVSDSQMLVEATDVTFTTRLIEVAFPEYDRIIPQSFKTRVVVGKVDLTQAIKAASLFSKTGIHDVSVHCNSQDQSITVTSVNSQLGENVSKLNAEVSGDTTTIVFNFRYLLDGLSQMVGESLELHLVDSTTPGMMRPIGGLNEQYFYIIMPIKQ